LTGCAGGFLLANALVPMSGQRVMGMQIAKERRAMTYV